MEMYKFINENQVERATNPLFVDGVAYSNPTKETLIRLGYKEMRVEPMPTYDIETEMVIPKYTDGEVIIQSWEVVPNEFIETQA